MSLSPLEKYLIEQARLIAPNCEPSHRHVSFIVQRNKVLSIGINSYKTHTLAAKFGHRGAHIHSELAAIVNLPRTVDMRRCTMYNVKVRFDNTLSIGKPCIHCQKLIIAFNIGKVLYSTKDQKFETF